MCIHGSLHYIFVRGTFWTSYSSAPVPFFSLRVGGHYWSKAGRTDFLAMADWASFLKSVDEEDPGEVLIQTVSKFMEKSGFSAPAKVAGVKEDAILGLPDVPPELPVKAFISRAVTAINLTAEATRAAKATSPVKMSSAGPSGSALGLATSMVQPSKVVDTKALLTKAGLAAVPFDFQAEPKIWEMLSADNEIASVRGNKAFTYVDLTCKELLPMWMSPEDVGGKLHLHDSGALEANSSTADLQSL